MYKNTKVNEESQYVPLDDWTNYFYTSDFDLSVTLICKGHSLTTIDAALVQLLSGFVTVTV